MKLRSGGKVRRFEKSDRDGGLELCTDKLKRWLTERLLGGSDVWSSEGQNGSAKPLVRMISSSESAASWLEDM